MNPVRRRLFQVGAWLAAKAAGAQAIGQGSLTPMSTELIKFLAAGGSSTGKVVTDSNAMGVSGAFSCMRIITEAVGMMPWVICRRDGDSSVEAPDHPLASVLMGSPNRDMTDVEFKEAMGLNLCQAGNTYSLQERLGGEVVSLYPVPSNRVRPLFKNGYNTRLPIRDGEVFYSVEDRGKWEDYPREKIWHVKGFGSDGLIGLSPLGCAREAMGLSMAYDEYSGAFFRQGGKPSGTVTIPGWLNEEQRKIARENLTQLLGGLPNMHKWALLEGGMTPTPFDGMPLKDLEFVLLKRFTLEEICRFYRIPPHMVASIERGASYASIEQMSSEFVMFTLMPYLTRIESSFSRWLLRPEDRNRYYLHFKYEGLLRADSAARAEFYSSALQNGYMNRNEVRIREGLNRMTGLDGFTAQTNLAPVAMLGDLARAASARQAPAAPKAVEANPTNVNVGVNFPSMSIPVTVPVRVEGAKVGVPVIENHNHVAPAQVHMPAAAKWPTRMTVEVPGLADMAVKSEIAAALALKSADDTRAALAKIHERMGARRVVYKDGEPVGSEPIEEETS